MKELYPYIKDRSNKFGHEDIPCYDDYGLTYIVIKEYIKKLSEFNKIWNRRLNQEKIFKRIAITVFVIGNIWLISGYSLSQYIIIALIVLYLIGEYIYRKLLCFIHKKELELLKVKRIELYLSDLYKWKVQMQKNFEKSEQERCIQESINNPWVKEVIDINNLIQHEVISAYIEPKGEFIHIEQFDADILKIKIEYNAGMRVLMSYSILSLVSRYGKFIDLQKAQFYSIHKQGVKKQIYMLLETYCLSKTEIPFKQCTY